MAAGAAATAQSGFAILGGIALQKAMLAFAPDFRWLILAFHFIISILLGCPIFRGATTPPAANPPFGA
jgi:hypothetical protein